MNYKYFIRLKVNNNYITQSLKDWARNNQKEFPQYGFTNNSIDIPTTHQIRDYLIKECNYKQSIEGNMIYLVRS